MPLHIQIIESVDQRANKTVHPIMSALRSRQISCIAYVCITTVLCVRICSSDCMRSELDFMFFSKSAKRRFCVVLYLMISVALGNNVRASMRLRFEHYRCFKKKIT